MNESLDEVSLSGQTSYRRTEPTFRERLRQAFRSRTALILLMIGVLVLFWVLGSASGTSLGDMLSLTVWGIMLGGILALGAIGLTLAYGVMKFPNFGHGALLTFGAYTAYAVLPFLPGNAPLRPFSFGWDLLIGLVIAIPVVAIIAFLCDFILFRPLRRRNASILLVTMASLAVAFFLRSMLYLIWGGDYRFYYSGRTNPALHLPFGIHVQADQLFILALALILVFLTWLLLARTMMGKAMRATANNPELAQVRGINTERVITWTWALAGGMAAAGGVMYALASQLRPEMGFIMLLPMFAAAILGSIGNPIGAFVGAIIIGIAYQLSSAFLNPAYGPGIAFLIMILVLIVRPEGLFVPAGD